MKPATRRRFRFVRLLALVLAAGYPVFGYLAGGWEVAAALGLLALFPLGCIFISGRLRQAVEDSALGLRIERKAPARFAAFFGWVVLLLPYAGLALDWAVNRKLPL